MTAVGGKAGGLARISETGLVPDYVVLPGDWIDSHFETLDADLPPLIAEAHLVPPYAVRSSGFDEDSLTASFAGMYDTKLGVERASLCEAIIEVARSGASPRVKEYREAMDLPSADGSISVIIQEMVDATVAGVVFSRDPSIPGCARVEAVAGIGDELVSGIAIPERFLISRMTGEEREHREGRQYIAKQHDGSRRRLSGRDVRARRLTSEQAREIALRAVALESVFPEAVHGVDVEWAIGRRGLRLLQCRPITSPPEPFNG